MELNVKNSFKVSTVRPVCSVHIIIGSNREEKRLKSNCLIY